MQVFSRYRFDASKTSFSDSCSPYVQTVDVILAWLVAEDDGAKGRINSLLAERDEGLEIIKATLTGIVVVVPCFMGTLSDKSIEQLGGMEEGADEDLTAIDMLRTLLQFL